MYPVFLRKIPLRKKGEPRGREFNLVYTALSSLLQGNHDSILNTATKLIYLLIAKMQFWVKILLGK